ncbi:ferredoxin [Planosporangium sp. 12N6]|uniref:ferredoxin n=1 Tax=Planosporangium spinosum TaxID=3402278 RepID=UPI003CEE78C8
MWRIRVDSGCIGSGSCAGVAPDHFALGADNRSHPITSEVEPDEAVRDAAASCPVEAITVTDADTGTVVEP